MSRYNTQYIVGIEAIWSLLRSSKLRSAILPCAYVRMPCVRNESGYYRFSNILILERSHSH